MTDYPKGIKKEVAEIKFLIHDLRVEKFINEIIHFHVTLNTDLEIYNIDQAQVLHGQDLNVLKAKAVGLRKAFQDYSNAVKSFSPDKTVLLTGKRYIDAIYSTCELILNPLWGRIHSVVTFLPGDSRSVQGRAHYLNCIHWLRGVYRRIGHFLNEQANKDVYEEFDIASDIEYFTRDVIYGYVMENSRGRVQIELAKLDPAVIGGNLPRFRRMYFNLVMNAVDAMSNREVGVLSISTSIEGDRVALRVRDNGAGMTEEKIRQLLTDRETLDGELHSLGFVFVRQTIGEFKGDLEIESEIDKGTTITVRLPYMPDKKPVPRPSTSSHDFGLLPKVAITSPGDSAPATPLPQERNAGATEPISPPPEPPAAAQPRPSPDGEDKQTSCGRMIYKDYEACAAQFPGSIFAISITDEDKVDFFTHRPYDRYWNMSHEDLSPAFSESSIRGRLEEDEEKKPVLILKEPQNVRDYFDFKNVPEKDRNPQKHIQMVHDEYIRIARKLIETGLQPETAVELTGVERFFPGEVELPRTKPFPLKLLAKQELTIEKGN
jgi:hypothetical protein